MVFISLFNLENNYILFNRELEKETLLVKNSNPIRIHMDNNMDLPGKFIYICN